jgi:hypothetical protein
MTFQFELTKEDFIAFNKHYGATSTTLRKFRKTVTLAVVLVAIYFSIRAKDFITALPWLMGALTYIAFTLLRKNKPSTFIIRRLLDERSMAAYIGVHRVSITDHTFKCEYPGGTSEIALSSIIRFCETADHLFLYNSSISAIILPKGQVPSDVVVALRKRFESIIEKP